MNTSSKEFFFAGNYQITLYPVYSESIEDMLNSRGLQIYSDVRASEKLFKAEFDVYVLLKENSGSWTPDNKSPFFDSSSTPLHCFNSWNNYTILGRQISSSSKNNGQWFKTSCCIFVNPDEHWCFTSNGSFYKLGTLISIEDMSKINKK